MNFEYFDSNVAFALQGMKIGRNDSGSAVLSNDPACGPLPDEDFMVFTTKLVAALDNIKAEDPNFPLERFSLAVAWLFIALGSNPKNISLLHEDDLQKEPSEDGTYTYWLRVPRIKKRDARERSQFKTRKLLPRIGRLLEEIISDNACMRSHDCLEAGVHYARPLLRRRTAHPNLLDSPFEPESYRYTSAELAAILKKVVATLNLTSIATGSPLKISPRRLRYTFATRLVQEGASPLELAEALDHTDTSHVMVYFNARSDAVRHLDKALALALGPHAQAFLGIVVRQKEDAERGADPASLVYRTDSSRPAREPIGNCGSFGFCGLYAPIACYTCTFFRPWLDGPHERVLDDLLSLRNRRLQQGADSKLTRIHDGTILAIGDVLDRCRQMRGNLTGEQE